jgi:hypothetical protein
MDKFYVTMKEEQPKQADSVFFAGKSLHIIFSIWAKGLLQCPLDLLPKGKRGVSVSRYNVEDARVSSLRLSHLLIP